jgi:hypothetical protein
MKRSRPVVLLGGVVVEQAVEPVVVVPVDVLDGDGLHVVECPSVPRR